MGAGPAAASRCPVSPPTPDPRQVRPGQPRARQSETPASQERARPAPRAEQPTPPAQGHTEGRGVSPKQRTKFKR